MLKIEHLKKHYDNFSLDCSLELTITKDKRKNKYKTADMQRFIRL